MILFIVGLLLILIAISDLIYTTFSPDGAGFVTNAITGTVYRGFRMVALRTSFKVMEFAGIFMITLILVFWYVTIWIGSALLIGSDPGSVLDSEGNPVDMIGVFYYTGFSLTTLGIGDYTAAYDGWRIFSVVLSFTGFALITIGISYMVPVLSAVVAKRRLGTYIATLGGNPEQILLNMWNGRSFKKMETHVNQILPMILQHNQQLLAYPVVSHFNTHDSRKASTLNIARLDEVITILMLLIPPKNRPAEQQLYPLREAITDYLLIQKKYFVEPVDVEDFPPDLSLLKDEGIPLMEQEEQAIEEKYEYLKDRRQSLGMILRDQGRSFESIFLEQTPDEPHL